MRIRICTIGVPRFLHAGLQVGEGWTAVDLEAIAPRTRAALLTYVGHFIRVHAEDVPNLAVHGLALAKDGRLVEAAPAAGDAAAPPPAEPEPAPAAGADKATAKDRARR